MTHYTRWRDERVEVTVLARRAEYQSHGVRKVPETCVCVGQRGLDNLLLPASFALKNARCSNPNVRSRRFFWKAPIRLRRHQPELTVTQLSMTFCGYYRASRMCAIVRMCLSITLTLVSVLQEHLYTPLPVARPPRHGRLRLWARTGWHVKGVRESYTTDGIKQTGRV